jgi:hypothetical protein
MGGNVMEVNLDILVNDKPLSSFGGASLLDYTIGETPMNNITFQGMNRTAWSLIKSTFGMRPVSLTIIFTAPSLHAAKMNRSRFNAEVCGESEIYIPGDGFTYRVWCKGLGEEELVGIGDKSAQIKSTYQFTGLRHLPLVTEVVNGVLECESTMPFTDCRLTVTVSTAAASYALGGATFQNVSAGDVLVFDGILKTITKNGQPTAQNVSWVRFPFLTPGINTITAADDVTVEYYPAFI